MKFSYFSSIAGRKLIASLAIATTTGLFAANYVPHTFGLDYYREFMQCLRNGQEIPVSPKLIERLNKASDLLGLDSRERDLLKPFSVVGFEIFTAGSTKLKYGAIVGIPSTYEIDNVKDLKKETICYQGNKIDWNSTTGKLLEEALLLTEEEQIFGFCKALLQVQNNYCLMNSIYPSVSFFMVYTIGNYFNNSLNLFRRPFAPRFCMYSILSLFGFGIWSFMKDYHQVSRDAEIDAKLSSISPKIIEAGIGYYNKQLNRNIALREVANDNSFTVTGNHNYFLRQKSLPLTLRKSFFEEKYSEYLKTIN